MCKITREVMQNRNCMGKIKKINRYNNKKTMQIAIKLCDKLPIQERWQLKT